MAQSEPLPAACTASQLVPLLQELLLLAQQQRWDAFISKSEALAQLDYRIVAAAELDDSQAARLRADAELAQQLLAQVNQLAQQERQELAGHLQLMSTQSKLNATYGQ